MLALCLAPLIPDLQPLIFFILAWSLLQFEHILTWGKANILWVFHNLLFHFDIIVVRTYVMETRNLCAWLGILYILFCSYVKVQWPVIHLTGVRWGMNYGLYHMHWQLSNKWWSISMLELSWGYCDVNKLFSVMWYNWNVSWIYISFILIMMGNHILFASSVLLLRMVS